MENLKKEEPEENQQSVLGMRCDGDWMLYAGYNDQEKIRNVFSANLWYESCAENNIFDVKNGMEYRYVETFFNDHYMGLYAIGFPIDELQLELQHALKSDHVSEFLLKKMRWVENIETDEEYISRDEVASVLCDQLCVALWSEPRHQHAASAARQHRVDAYAESESVENRHG